MQSNNVGKVVLLQSKKSKFPVPQEEKEYFYSKMMKTIGIV